MTKLMTCKYILTEEDLETIKAQLRKQGRTIRSFLKENGYSESYILSTIKHKSNALYISELLEANGIKLDRSKTEWREI